MTDEERAARRALLTAALEKLEAIKVEDAFGPAAGDDQQRTLKLIEHAYHQRLDTLQREEERQNSTPARNEPDASVFVNLSARVRQSEREELLRLLSAGDIGDGTARKLERELDLLDIRFPSSLR